MTAPASAPTTPVRDTDRPDIAHLITAHGVPGRSFCGETITQPPRIAPDHADRCVVCADHLDHCPLCAALVVNDLRKRPA